MSDLRILSNAEIVTSDDRFRGYVVIENGLISEIGKGTAPEKGIDLGGDFLLPGLVEIHTDNLEAHFIPRPKVMWHVDSAVQAYDGQIATSGITTVFDSLRIGTDEHETRAESVTSTTIQLAEALARARVSDTLRVDHRTHLRCEVPTLDVVEALGAYMARFPVDLISLMDHTPGQRQFRDIEKYFIYYGGRTGKSPEEVQAVVKRRQLVGSERAAMYRPMVVEIAHKAGIALASHDDTTLEEVRESVEQKVSIAEFPTTLEAAEASQGAGMATVMGAPNVVRGGSHSGNVAARDLADAGLLDMLSSDYVPASLLLGAFHLADCKGLDGLPGAINLVTRNPARALGLDDRGVVAVGKRADLIRVTTVSGTPVVRTVWRCGERVA
ncbi:MAG: alpha-D-ribose 1-methylphosphonate 5-triphosphate diphosphatase [Bosea sp. (in: a-proteobacteria)]